MIKRVVKNTLKILGVQPHKFSEGLGKWSINMALNEKRQKQMLSKLRSITPDLSEQYSTGMEHFNDYRELKTRSMHVFQCSLMLKYFEQLRPGLYTVVDIGDSAGTHMNYLRELLKDKYDIQTISINLDQKAVDKIKSKGQKALLLRAEDLCSLEEKIDLYTSFQMVEHLHDPVLFFRRLALKSTCNRMLLTVPYLRSSRVGLHHIRNRAHNIIYAERVHIFELAPDDWKLLFQHSGWKIIHSEIYYQYPKKIPVISSILSWFWRNIDFEGFWGVILEKDLTFSDLYQDWGN